jgi:hypothetical protein
MSGQSGQSRKISRCRASRPTSSQPFMPPVGQPVGAAGLVAGRVVGSVVGLVLAISSIATAVPMAASSAAAQGQQAAEATSTSMVPNAADEAATEPEVDEEGGSEVDGPEDPTSFRLSAAIAGGGYAEFLVDATLPTLQLALTGMGLSDLNLVVIDDELGMLAVGAAPRDRERLTITNEYPRTLRVLVLNGGRNANVFTLSGY